jgi:predicted nucleic acid-binding Zn ribbon protein
VTPAAPVDPDEAAGPPDPEHVVVWLRFKEVFGGIRTSRRQRRDPSPGKSVPFEAGRDPSGIADVMAQLTRTLGWDSSLSKAELLSSWADLAGAEVAEHAQPAGIEEGVLIVRCDSTAWATQLRLMRTEITTRIAQRHPDAGVESVRFEGPGVPNWKRGPRTIPGRGPRDTYG